MSKALDLIEKCLATLDPVLDLGNCGLSDGDLDLYTPLGSALVRCSHLTRLILSNDSFHWNLDEPTVLITNGAYLYKSRPEFWKEGQPKPLKEPPISYFAIPDYRPRVEKEVLVRHSNIFDAIPDAVQLLFNLEELVCGGTRDQRWGINNLQPLRGLKKLKTLVLSNNEIDKIDCLDYFPDLEKLDLGNNRIVSLLAIQSHKRLKALDLSYNKLTNIGEISKFPFLQWLNVSSNQLQIMDRVDELPLLQHLDLSDNQIATFKTFKRNALLRVLNLSENQLSQLYEIGELPNLKYLYARRNKIHTITGIKSLQGLQLLDLSHNMMDHIPQGFNQLLELRVLDVSNNALQVLKHIDGMQRLTILNAANNLIKSIKLEQVLPALEDLILNNNRLSILSVFTWCPKLEKLFVAENDLEWVIGVGPSALKVLVLFKNKISNLLFIRGCEQLTYLDVSSNKISELEQSGHYPKLSSLFAEENAIAHALTLQHYPALVNVDLSMNLIERIELVADLPMLETIYLHYNSITELGEWRNLPCLKRIGVQCNEIRLLPVDWALLPALTDINASYNKIIEMPDLAGFPKLERCNLAVNSITVIKAFEPHPSLQQLSLSTNRIKVLPDLYSLLQFRELDLCHNLITTVNKFIRALRKDNDLEITGDRSGTLRVSRHGMNLLLNGAYFDVPRQILNDDSISIKNWFIARDEGGYINLEAKCILFGNGETGKTALSHYLRTGNFFPVNDRTHGIMIDTWKLGRNEWTDQFGTSIIKAVDAHDMSDAPVRNESFTFNIWDFGGQEFYHATHRLFMSTDVLYLVLWEQESDYQDEERGIFPKEYWVDNIQHYAAGSAVLLVQNRADKVFYVEEDNCYKIGTYDKLNPESVSRYHLDMQLLKDGIFKRVSTLPHFGMYTPEVYQQIKEVLEYSRRHYISFEEYRSICVEADNTDGRIMEDVSQCESLLKYLDNIGSVVCFRHRERMKDELMRDYVFTRPRWLVGVIYQILEKGRAEFDLAHVEKVVAAYNLPAELWVKVMQNFGLIFEVVSKQGLRYIVPQYLPKECQDQRGLELVLSCKKMVHAFTVSYPRFMPGGNFLRLISHYGSAHLEYLFWKKGLVFFKDGKTVFVECVNNVDERKIRVSVQDLEVGVAMDVFDTILGIDWSEDVEVSIDEVNYVVVSLLKKKVMGGHLEVDATNGRTLATKDFNYLFNMEQLNLKEKTIRIFVSYSSRDRKLKEMLVNGLREHLVTRPGFNYEFWSDQAIDMGADWHGEIKENIRNSDVAILLVSASFAASPYIRKEELEEFLEKMKVGRFVMLPVLVRSFDFMSFRELAGFQFFKAYYREYGFTAPGDRDRFMAFDVLGEDGGMEDRWLNDYYKNLADGVERAVRGRFL
ncbi:leucine-rich repeat domain-containing protein [Chitinophaga silvisoli]|uniref:TIR domain-containing protein n=1 Tax=Chitinophaga silvisoli TaxID=2291814 RepID=A0A3E1NSQ3_9BACT|nr:leucine-rich repeat domain-containing protein [Chitinophaga silvisoli]RFM30966.1 TIR domain-containing protein [Chitinophaga silvisoli]